ncbi:hypothetical protein BMS3Abin10_02521 [bacterium BMS3Abin10]|nr:hypothetical protein BMS3Abin10_02521 [bacterium BMS3Abin10]
MVKEKEIVCFNCYDYGVSENCINSCKKIKKTQDNKIAFKKGFFFFSDLCDKGLRLNDKPTIRADVKKKIDKATNEEQKREIALHKDHRKQSVFNRVELSSRQYQKINRKVFSSIPDEWLICFPDKQKKAIKAHKKISELRKKEPTYREMNIILRGGNIKKTPQAVHSRLKSAEKKAKELKDLKDKIDNEPERYLIKKRGDKFPVLFKREYVTYKGKPEIRYAGQTVRKHPKDLTQSNVTVHKPSSINLWWDKRIRQLAKKLNIGYKDAYLIAYKTTEGLKTCRACETPLPLGVSINSEKITRRKEYCDSTCKKLHVRKK